MGAAGRERAVTAFTQARCTDRTDALYRAALAEEPKNATAREGLSALLYDPACAAGAVMALVKAFGETDEWWETLALLEQRLRVADDDEARAAILLDAATTQEDGA